ncbi:MAG: hypothetical protein ACRDK3_08590 [Actinomycetota bacterium]
MRSTWKTITLGLLSVSAFAAFVAWQLQSAAGGALERAEAIQTTEVPADDAASPDLRQYRAILERLDESIVIRGAIDERLAEIEAIVAELRTMQEEATSISDQATDETQRIGGALGGALEATRTSTRGLGSVRARLEISARLAGRIAQELEELDRSLGPTVGRRP